ncbi:hypothetical protein LOAG_10796 [Loa loa]|nr:hypothetical protein LOAG_10796 [Loa loa]EFO17704.1 hypothetical protein LOAG_10796 [Loa loa]
MKNAIEVISKKMDKVKIEDGKEIGAKFRLGRFGAQFFAPVTKEPNDISSDDDDDDDNDDDDGKDVESEHSEDEN